MRSLVLAEKPSVARDLARVLGAQRRREGYLEGEGYVVTWALGHLVQFAEPDDYGPPWNGRWSLKQLPIVPPEWKLKTDRRTAGQFRVVRDLLNAPDTGEVIVATDAGREGENIFRLIYQHAHCRKPFRRLWVSSLTDAAIREGLAHLQAGHTFDDLAAAARARAQADWLIGMNLTRAYTVHNRVLCTIGRVQTPTLAMLVQREKEIVSFEKALFYEVAAHLQEGFSARYGRDGQTRIDRREEAEEVLRRLTPYRTGTVSRIETTERHLRPPPLYNLVDLQREANRRLGMTAAKTLEQAQRLYETHKVITYPRTESRHLSEDMVPKLPRILEKVHHPLAAAALQRLQQGHRLGRAHVDRNKLTDHHAIIPTDVPPTHLPPPLRPVYDLVVSRFVAAFLPDHVLEETEVTVEIGGEPFVARGVVVLVEGWRAAEGRRQQQDRPGPTGKDPDSAEADAGPGEAGEEPPLPSLQQGQQVHVERLELVEKETQPPRRYTDASLLTAMKNAGRRLEDDALAAAMKESGLGTPATRAETIERLIRTGYVQREKRALVPTEKGKALVEVVAEPLRNPELTARWEQRLKEIEEGRFAAGEFYTSIVRLVEELVPVVRQSPCLPPESRTPGTAASPTRGASRRSGRKPGAAGEEAPQTSSGGPDPPVSLGEDAERTGHVPDLGACPACGQGAVVENRKAYGCSRFREGCRFTIWKEVAGKKLTAGQVQELLHQGRTGRLKGFRSRAGKRFAAALRLDEEFRVVLDFGPAAGAAAAAGSPRPPAPGPAPLPRPDAGPPRGSPASAPQGGRAEAVPPQVTVAGDAGGPGPRASPRRSRAAAQPAAAAASCAPPSLVGAGSAPGGPAPSSQASQITPDPLPSPVAPGGRPGPLCPKCCEGTIIEGRRGFGCSRFREGCDFVVWKEVAGKRLTAKQVLTLIEKGKTAVLRGFRDEAGEPFAARLYLGPRCAVVTDRQRHGE